MEFDFYVIEGETAKKINADYDERNEVFKKRILEWEEKYAPLKVSNQSRNVACNEKIKPSDFGLLKGYKSGDTYFYEFKDKTIHENGKHHPLYQDYQALHKLRPSLKELIRLEFNFPFNDFVFEPISNGDMRGRVYQPKVGTHENTPGTIFIKNPIDNEKDCCDKEETLIPNRPDIRKLKESEWLALMGK